MDTLRYVTGCTASSLPTINDKELCDVPLEEQKQILLRIIDKHPEEAMKELFMQLLELYGECECSGPCQTCGDIIEKYTLEI